VSNKPKKAEFESGDLNGRRIKSNADNLLPVRNMVNYGCNGKVIKAPVYSDRAYQLCSPVGCEEFNKIVGSIQDIRPPTMLAKQRYHKDDFQTQDRIRSTPGYSPAQLTGPLEQKPRPFFGGRKKER